MRLGACSIWSSLSHWSLFFWNLNEMSLNPYFLNLTKKHFWCVLRFLLQFDIKFFWINLTFINWRTWTSMPRFSIFVNIVYTYETLKNFLCFALEKSPVDGHLLYIFTRTYNMHQCTVHNTPKSEMKKIIDRR